MNASIRDTKGKKYNESTTKRHELSGTGIDVAIVEPGGFGTEFWSKLEPVGDAERMASYGSLVELPQQMYGGMGELLNGDNAPNPQDVADAVLQLIETRAGERPLRTVIDLLMGGEGPTAINQTTWLLVRKELRTQNLLQYQAKDRYLAFKQQFPELAERVPQYHIASYLGITEVSLSRFKRSLRLAGQPNGVQPYLNQRSSE